MIRSMWYAFFLLFLFHFVQCVDSSSFSSSSSSSSALLMLQKRASHLNHQHISSTSSFSSSAMSAATKLANLAEVAAKFGVGEGVVVNPELEGCSALIQSCLNLCNRDLTCEVGCGARASSMYFSHYEVADDSITKACDKKCSDRVDSMLCRQICNKGFRDHYYMQPKEDRQLYCVNTVKTRLNPFASDAATVKCAVDCQHACNTRRKVGTVAHATCMVQCTHNSAHAYFEIMRPTIHRIRTECGSDLTCVHRYTDSWILTSDECDDAVLDWPSTPADLSYCADWCDAFYDPGLPKEMNWPNSCLQGCEQSYAKTERKWDGTRCGTLCGELPEKAGDQEAFVSGCYEGCRTSIAK